MRRIDTLNNYGLEVTSGIILGLDTDSADTEERLKTFIDASNVPILTINLLQALPKTPLWDRLKRDGRVVADDTGLESNVVFLRPYDEVVAMWRRCIEYAYAPERLFKRFAHQVEATYANRLVDGPVRGKLTWNNLSLDAGAGVQYHPLHIGIAADYRRWFWKAALPALRRGQIDGAFSMGIVGHHMITFSREAAARRAERLVLFGANAPLHGRRLRHRRPSPSCESPGSGNTRPAPRSKTRDRGRRPERVGQRRNTAPNRQVIAIAGLT